MTAAAGSPLSPLMVCCAVEAGGEAIYAGSKQNKAAGSTYCEAA